MVDAPRMPKVELLHVDAVRHLGEHKLWLRFSDGVEGTVDMRDRLGGPVFESLRNPDFFARVVLQDGYTIAWPNDVDIAPEALYHWLEVTPPAQKRDHRKEFDERRREAVRQVARMPEISRFFGIVIHMMWNEHELPHFHAQYAEYAASIDVRDGSVATHRFPPRALRLVEKWRKQHKRELLENWERMRSGEPPRPIEPLI